MTKAIPPKVWCEKTNAIGILSRQGNGGGIYVHPVIALDFLMWQRPILRYFMLDSLADKKKPEEHPTEEPQEESDRTITKIPSKPAELV